MHRLHRLFHGTLDRIGRIRHMGSCSQFRGGALHGGWMDSVANSTECPSVATATTIMRMRVPLDQHVHRGQRMSPHGVSSVRMLSESVTPYEYGDPDADADRPGSVCP